MRAGPPAAPGRGQACRQAAREEGSWPPGRPPAAREAPHTQGPPGRQGIRRPAGPAWHGTIPGFPAPAGRGTARAGADAAPGPAAPARAGRPRAAPWGGRAFCYPGLPRAGEGVVPCPGLGAAAMRDRPVRRAGSRGTKKRPAGRARKPFRPLVTPARIERAAYCLGGSRSILLSYEVTKDSSTGRRRLRQGRVPAPGGAAGEGKSPRQASRRPPRSLRARKAVPLATQLGGSSSTTGHSRAQGLRRSSQTLKRRSARKPKTRRS